MKHICVSCYFQGKTQCMLDAASFGVQKAEDFLWQVCLARYGDEVPGLPKSYWRRHVALGAGGGDSRQSFSQARQSGVRRSGGRRPSGQKVQGAHVERAKHCRVPWVFGVQEVVRGGHVDQILPEAPS
eukprot:3693871-Pyramimonas_sp.AAC.1